MNRCENQGFDLAGVVSRAHNFDATPNSRHSDSPPQEHANQCFCDKQAQHMWKPPPNTGADEKECNTACRGSATEKCGGFCRINVYNFTCSGPPDPVPPPPPPPPPPPQVYPKAQPCNMEPLKSAKVCDPTADLEDRVADVISRIPEEDLFTLYSDQSGGVPSLNIPYYNWWSEALHGVSRCPYQGFLPKNESTPEKCCVLYQGAVKCPTSFPAGITSSASFNKTLFRAIGSAVGEEARVMSNAGIASLTFWVRALYPSPWCGQHAHFERRLRMSTFSGTLDGAEVKSAREKIRQ